ncbi:APC family permease [Embleya sp. NPDC020630]|uniref:APC family permease n=1 Tax=Embleya sp. NPDC020630 TaxID=3363979 RepID=UPI0037AA0C63
MSTALPSPPASPNPKGGSLRRNTLSVFGAVAMCMAFMGPATSVAFNTPPAAAGAGYALPLAIVLAMVASLLVANTIAAFARKLPAAGFAYTYNSHGFGKSGGFLSGWLLLLTYGMVGPMLFAALGGYSHDFLDSQFDIRVPWQVMSLAFAAVVWGVNSLGVSSSAKTALIFLVLEVGVLLGLAGVILGDGGDSGLSVAPFNPANSIDGFSGLGTGMLWGILMFIGFESVATLGEEARGAKRSIPLALFTAVAVIGTFYVLMAYSTSIGFGSGHGSDLSGDAAPLTTLVDRYWGVTWILALTVIVSQFANVVSGSNAAVRVLFSMGREGVLPRFLGRTNERHVPQSAITAYLGFSLVFALALGSGFGGDLGPLGVYGFAGTILGLGMVIIYILMSIAVIRFYLREHRGEFALLRHGILPGATVLLMLLPIYGQLWPVPDHPNNLVPYVIVGWMVLGAAYLVWAHRSRPEVLAAMGRVFEDEPGDDTTETTDASTAASRTASTGVVPVSTGRT